MEILSVILIPLFIAGIIYLAINRGRFVGKYGEKRVALSLSFLPKEKYIILNDMMFSYNGYTTQIDHIVISIYGIFVIETKSHKGWIFGNYNRDYWTQNIWGQKYRVYNPIWQNEKHIKFLLNKFPEVKEKSDFIKSFIVFTRAERLQLTDEKCKIVLWTSELRNAILSHVTEIMSFSECENIANALLSANCVEKEKRATHNAHVREAHYRHENKIGEGICPKCGGRLVPRTGKYGNFLGCSNYPRCKFTR